MNSNNCIPKLSKKELMDLKDQLDYEQTVIRKIEHYKEDLSDPELKNICFELIKAHKNHYNTLVKHLNC